MSLDAKMLVAAVPDPFKWTKLPHVVQETAAIRDVVSSDYMLQLASPNAKASEVLRLLPEAGILHLACHGHQDAHDALKSGFVMSDRMLTVSELMGLRLPDASFAYLSVCETAKGDRLQPDQAIHLATTMLYVGFRSVVGTMW
jgi:CHAT domain-containing protein